MSEGMSEGVTFAGFGELWSEAYSKAMKIAKPKIEYRKLKDVFEEASMVEEKLKNIKKMLKSIGGQINVEELVSALANGGFVTVRGPNIETRIEVPSLGILKTKQIVEIKISEKIRRALQVNPNIAVRLYNKYRRIVPAEYKGTVDYIMEIAKIRGYCTSQRCELQCHYDPRKREFPFPPPCERRIVQKTVVFTPSGVKTLVGWHSVSKLKALFGPDIWAEWTQEIAPPSECPYEHRTKIPYIQIGQIETEDYTDRTPDHFPEDIIAVPGEDGSWKKVVHSPNHGWGSDELE
ncbi:MAG: hypothetical protein QW540_09050 [Archaeoglobaceae archaeon]